MRDRSDNHGDLEPEELELRLIELLIEIMGMDQEEFERFLAKLKEEEEGGEGREEGD